TRDIQAGIRSAPAFRDDLVERHRCGVDDADAGRAIVEQRFRHQRAGVEAYRAARDEVAAADGDEVGCAGAGADEVYGHGGPSAAAVASGPVSATPWPSAMAQAASAEVIRGASKRAAGPAPVRAAASATDGTPFNATTRSETVSTASVTPSISVAVKNRTG